MRAHDLSRFVDAQSDSYDTALAEIRSGQKHSHWMWFIFPQMRGLGRSAMAQHYGIASLDEARAYLAHPALAPATAPASRPSTRSAQMILSPSSAQPTP